MEVINTIGRRKTAIARIYLAKGNGGLTVNHRAGKEYFPTAVLQDSCLRPLSILNLASDYDVKVNVRGGGITGQAEAICLAIARALVKIDAANKPALKAEGLLTRDPRMVERKKFGQKKARKRFQFSKR